MPRSLLPVPPMVMDLADLLLKLQKCCISEVLTAVWGWFSVEALETWLRQYPHLFVIMSVDSGSGVSNREQYMSPYGSDDIMLLPIASSEV